MTKDEIIAYTDGSAVLKGKCTCEKEDCPKCNQYGGYGVYIIDGEKEYMFKGGYKYTKTGRMELRAVITCLQKIKNKRRHVKIYSDSMYIVNAVNEGWLLKWERDLWQGRKNVDLIKQYLFEYRKFTYPPKLIHVKGHTGKEDENSLGNAVVDRLADYRSHKKYIEDERLE
jgi:ribonuclease HI